MKIGKWRSQDLYMDITGHCHIFTDRFVMQNKSMHTGYFPKTDNFRQSLDTFDFVLDSLDIEFTSWNFYVVTDSARNYVKHFSPRKFENCVSLDELLFINFH